MHKKKLVIARAMKSALLLLGCSSLLLLSSCQPGKKPAQNQKTEQEPVAYADPFVGTGGHGHTYPGATVPFGMVQVSPDNGHFGWDYCSGYHYPDSTIAGFSVTHLSGTGGADGSDLLFMPFDGSRIDTSKGATYSHYSHKNESAEPGFYHVTLDNGISVDLTASARVAFYRYHFAQSDKPAVSLNLGYGNSDRPTGTYINEVNDTLVTGYRMSTGWARDQRVYFAAVFNKPIEKFVVSNKGHLLNDQKEAKGKYTHGYFIFGDLGDSPLLQKVAISSVSIDNAKENLSKEVPGWDFQNVRKAAYASWEKQLSKIEVTSDNVHQLRTFYSSLYHTMLAPTLFMDTNGQYQGADGKVHTAKGFTNYSTFSIWDTYRAEHPLFTLIEPNRVNDFVQFMLAFYHQYGLLPIWELWGNETNTMIGYHSIPIMVDAYFKGFRNYDVQEAFKAMKKSATEENGAVKLFNRYGYVPSDKVPESVSKTLAFAFDDWCIAQMAKALGKEKDYQLYSKRAEYFKNLYDPTTGFMRPKLSNGKWLSPFDPFAEPSNGRKRNYTEANAWQVLWYVPQNVPELEKLIGGREKFVKRLDTLFVKPPKIDEGGVPDMSGMIGEYVQGNEPDQQVPYMYDYAGAPWRTQAVTRTIVDSLYKDTPQGLPGNEDCGQMSAWYVFSALGFYPVNPDNGTFEIGSPIFPRAAIHLKGNKTFTVIADNVSKENKYIQSATLNGQTYDKPYITYQDIIKGGQLHFVMGPKPNKNWGSAKEDQPPITAFNMSE